MRLEIRRSFAAIVLVLLAALVVHPATCAHNLKDQEYQFSVNLDDGYKLHWNFDLEQQTIAFAVNVSTTGWVGFGLSPNGQMPQSDVVIGWVDNDGNTQFRDHFAIDRFLPPVDTSQDWFLVSGKEEDGSTTLEFTRNLTTCDDKDLDIKADTARIIWAYHSQDPVPNVIDLNSLQHEKMGSISLNLLGESIEGIEIEEDGHFLIGNEDVLIPNKDTTYWCSVHSLPDEVLQQKKYIYKFSPVFSKSSAQYVHHMVVYLCSDLNHTHIGASSECADSHIDIALCRGSVGLIGVWAVGGDGFTYPRDVAYPIGGEGTPRYMVLETHYNNPAEVSGVNDSSGLVFTYVNEPLRHNAGILMIGQVHNNHFIIPPRREDYNITGICPASCTNTFLSPEGIKVFGNMFHTHTLGHGLLVQHFRENAECGVLEELEPIDENERYDFNYQQFTYLNKEVKILPGDTIQLRCFYQSTGSNNVTLGGEGTQQEMCYAFLLYYPQVDLSSCYSQPPSSAYSEFTEQHIQVPQRDNFYQSLLAYDSQTAQSILDQVEWTDDASSMIEALLNKEFVATCIHRSDQATTVDVPTPQVGCSYKAPDTCGAGGNTPQLTCCERMQVLSGDAAKVGHGLPQWLLCITFLAWALHVL